MTFFITALAIMGLVFIVACICSTIEKVIKIKNPPSVIERILTPQKDEEEER